MNSLKNFARKCNPCKTLTTKFDPSKIFYGPKHSPSKILQGNKVVERFSQDFRQKCSTCNAVLQGVQQKDG